MNNRKELLNAIKQKSTGMIPFTYEGTDETNEQLRKYLGLAENADIEEYFGCNQFSSVWEPFETGPHLPEREKKNETGDPNVQIDIWGIKREQTKAGNAEYFEISESPFAGAESIADIENYDWPTPDEVVFPELPEGFNMAEWKKDKVVLDMAHICPFGIPWAMRGLEQFMMDMYINPGMVEALVAKTEEYSLGCLQIVLDKYPGLIDLTGSGDDYGTQNGLLCSPDSIAQFFMPSLKRHYELAEKYGVIGYHHSCGAIFEVVPQFIEADVQVLNPIQTAAAGMDPASLKKEFGKDLCFHGGIDTQDILPAGKPDDIRNEVRLMVEQLGPDGYILAPSHVLQVDVPPENIIAMYDEIKKINNNK